MQHNNGDKHWQLIFLNDAKTLTVNQSQNSTWKTPFKEHYILFK